MPKISVILTSYNLPHYLQQAIESVFSQTEKDWELIIIDDSSTDPQVTEVLNWANRDSRVRVFRMERNINNLSIEWNKGIDISKGKYICLLDQDNKRNPRYLEKMADFLDANPEYPAVACLAYMLEDETLSGIFDGPLKMTRENIKYNNYVDSGCMMFRRSLIDEIGWFDERLKSCDDWDFVKRIMLQTDKGFGVIAEPLTYYRWHKANRMYTKRSLNDDANINFIVYRKNYNRAQSLLLFHQDRDKITLSQNNVLKGISSAMSQLPFVNFTGLSLSEFKEKPPEKLYDIIFNFAPFSNNLQAIAAISKFGKEVINFHIEDPQAVNANLERARYATYVFTNDIATVSEYEKIMGNGKVGFCPSISFDDINLQTRLKKSKIFDVVFYGYAYESRKRFVAELERKMGSDKLLVLIGGGWDHRRNICIRELSQEKSLEVLGKSKIVVLKNREKTDLGGDASSITPQSVVRGYFEMASGALVMLDSARKHHSFDDEIVFYDDVDDLVRKIDYYLKNDHERAKIGQAGKRRVLRDFTYQVRLRQVINAVRSQRFGFEVR